MDPPAGEGTARDVWSGSGTWEDGEPMCFLFTAWTCPSGTAFYGYHAGAPDTPREAALAALRTAACP